MENTTDVRAGTLHDSSGLILETSTVGFAVPVLVSVLTPNL